MIRLFCVLSRTHVGGALPLCRDTVGVFYSPSRLGQPCWGSLTPLQICSQYILQPRPIWPVLLGEPYPSSEMQSVYSTAPADLAGLVGGALPICRYASGVFYSPSQLGQSWWEAYPSAEMQSVYSTAPACKASLLGGALPLFRVCLILLGSIYASEDCPIGVNWPGRLLVNVNDFGLIWFYGISIIVN